jgi:hypothetical protein
MDRYRKDERGAQRHLFPDPAGETRTGIRDVLQTPLDGREAPPPEPEEAPADEVRERYREERVAHWDEVARSLDRWRGFGSAYHRRLERVFQTLVPPGVRLLGREVIHRARHSPPAAAVVRPAPDPSRCRACSCDRPLGSPE